MHVSKYIGPNLGKRRWLGGDCPAIYVHVEKEGLTRNHSVTISEPRRCGVKWGVREEAQLIHQSRLRDISVTYRHLKLPLDRENVFSFSLSPSPLSLVVSNTTNQFSSNLHSSKPTPSRIEERKHHHLSKKPPLKVPNTKVDATMAPDLSQNRALKIVTHAAKNKYAVPAICCYNIESIIASVRAAERKKSPVLIQLFPWAIHFAGGILVHAAKEAADNATVRSLPPFLHVTPETEKKSNMLQQVPVGVHMDHAQTPEIVKRAADLGGFDGIMVDMSHYEKEENFRLTKELVAYCNERGIVTEAEPGRIDGGEDGVGDVSALGLEAILTTPEQAEDFVSLGINWLAPAFGNVHGKYGPKGPQLDYERLKRVHAKVGDRVDLVLHGAGAEWFSNKEMLQSTIECGVAKINLNDAVNNEFIRVMAEKAKDTPLTALLEEATDAMQTAVGNFMDWMGSTGQAEKM
jgi:fructose-bisphosphate aldolase class II